MLGEVINNPIITVVEHLSILALVFVPLMVAVVQGLKQLTGLEGNTARLAAMAVNLCFGMAFVAVYLYPQAAGAVGVGIFLLVLVVAPLGGYDLLKRFAGGSPNDHPENPRSAAGDQSQNQTGRQ
jgi:hypothetical protein